jgi:hypothetical protein
MRLQTFPPVDLAQQLLLPSPEELVCEFPTIWHNFPEALNADIVKDRISFC